MQAWLERTATGRALISFMVVLTLSAILVTNMPTSEIKARISSRADPYLYITGLDQNWAIFAPNPRDQAVYVEGRVDHSDGTSSVWPISARTGAAAYWDYRWQKFGENLRLDENASMWMPFAEWVASRARAAGHKPVRVTLVRRWSQILPPGPGPDHGPWQEFAFFTLTLEGAR